MKKITQNLIATLIILHHMKQLFGTISMRILSFSEEHDLSSTGRNLLLIKMLIKWSVVTMKLSQTY